MRDGRPASAWANARQDPGTWYALDSKPRSDIREKRLADGYHFRVYQGSWWVAYIGTPIDVKVNTILL